MGQVSYLKYERCKYAKTEIGGTPVMVIALQ